MNMNVPINCFFMGKGGVGKSTSSTLFSLSLVQNGHKVALISMDPAHNLSDIFRIPLSDRPSQLEKGLQVMEVDQEKWIRDYLKDIQQQIQRSYAYLTSFNLLHYFDVIRFSPGLEEYALILAFQKIRQQFSTYDYLVFDMPPTALALKFFNLPLLSLIWTDKLLTLRKEIIEKRKLITRIKLLRKERETDKVLNRIGEQQALFSDLKEMFSDHQSTRVNLVLNPDDLSFSESIRIIERLQEMSIAVNQLLLNKTRSLSENATIEKAYPRIPLERIPLSETELNGAETLKNFLANNPIQFRY